MSDNDFEPFATAGSGKSEAEVAFDLLNKLKGQGVWGERNKSDILDMYAECLDAAKGLRPYAGQKRVDVPITTAVPAAAPAPKPAPVEAAPAAPQPEAQVQTQNPVHAQQKQVQEYQPQAVKRG